MKQQILHFILIVILSMAFPFNASGDDYRIIDFNYPQEVSKEALADLDNALKAGDGELTVDALVRYSIAQSGISKDNMPEIVKRLESTIAKEKKPHIKALLYYFEAMVYQGYCNRYARRSDRNNPIEEIPADVSEWDRNQFNKKIAELVEKSLAEPEALKAVAVTSLPGIIECNELGATYVPTLFEFLSMKSLELLKDNDELIDRIKTDWLDATDGHSAPNIYAMVFNGKGDLRAAYDRYRNSEYSALLLSDLSFDDNKQKYAELKQYLQRFPSSIYTAQVKNMIFDLEEKRIHVSYPNVISSRDTITVTADVNNVGTYWLNVYRISDNVKDTYEIDPKKLKFVSQTPVTVQGTVPFSASDIKTELPPLPYGCYVILPMLDKDERPQHYVYSYQLLRVTDIGNFTVSRKDKEGIIAAVDITTGKPLPDVTVVNKHNSKIGRTGNDGTLKLSNKYEGKLRTVKGDDRFSPENYYNQIHDRNYDEITAQFYSDLGVYRPGETIQWAIIVYRATDKGNTPWGGTEFKVIFKDSNYKDIDTVIVTSDEYGRIEGSFVIPKDRMNGRFHIYLDFSYLRSIGWPVNVSEYKTPTFEVTFPDARRSYVACQPVKVTGKAMNYSGVPIANSEVRLSLIQSQWSWWWWSMRNNNGKHLQDTTVVTDAQGNFNIEFAPDLFQEYKDLKPGKRCWARYNYRILATVTNEAGETHEESTSFIVGTRRGIELGSESENVYLNDQPIKLPLKYNTTDEEHPDTWCTWEVTKKGSKEPALTGNLNTADPTIDLTSLSSGEYTLKIHILDAEEGEQDVDVSRDIILYRKGDKTSPVKDCPLWISPLGKSVDKGNKGHITVGVSTPKAYIYYVASTAKDIISEGWLNYKAGMNDFTVPLPKEAGADVTVSFITHYGAKKWEKDVKLTNPYQAEALKITATSFRDKLVPGNIEHWSFTLSDQNGNPRPGAMLLDMYDKAIASIAENGWNYSVFSSPYRYPSFDIRPTRLGDHSMSTNSWWQGHLAKSKETQAQLPKLYTYGISPFSYVMGRGRQLLKTHSPGAARSTGKNTMSGRVVDEHGEPIIGASVVELSNSKNGVATDYNGNFSINCVEGATLKITYVGYGTVEVQALDGMVIELEQDDSMLDEVAVYGYQRVDKRLYTGSVQSVESVELEGGEKGFGAASKIRVRGVSSTEDAQVNQQNLDKVTLRESDVKTALWQPMLTSDQNGVVSLEFEVPNFNTTWIAQAVAWDKKMVGSTWMAEVLTQKPLMVRANMPRFLRQGDKATLAATVQNATEEPSACDAVIELFDPRTNEVYASRNFNLQLDPMGSQAVTIDWQVPDTIAMMGFRIKAANSTFGDGEQVMVPVLTTISPVIETEPFYIEAAQAHYETPLPQYPKDARVTLEYCDNPVWYCVLALPTIFSDSYCTATHSVHSLYALQVAQGVAKEQPQIKEAINYWKEHNEDSTLVSMLEKNQDLKIGTLLASPWMRDADRQTLRMSKLNELFDEAIVKKEYEKIITTLQSLQMGDGGFTWFRYPGCESSIWTTGTVLELIGEIKHLGYLPDDSRLTSMINRALAYYDSENVRLLNEYKRKYGNEPYGNFTGYAYTRSLFPEVKQSSASADLFKKTIKYMDKNWGKGITLKQKAYYAMTLNRNGYQKTARSIVESIRQFAILKPNLGMYWDNLQKDYGWWDYDKVAYTSTILQAMNEVDPRKDEIDLVRKWMLLMKQSNDWGTNSLAADAVYSILSTGSQWLERADNPTITVAGQPIALDKMAQYVGYFRTTLPATTTGNVVIDRTASGPAWGSVYSQFQAPMTQIKEKAIEEVSISKEYYVYAQDGTLHAATSFKVGDKVKVRVVIKTNKDMDFVTMTDERTACFEPVDQLSGYRNEDNTWFYQETKDTQTNVFINSLRKGTHIIGYDVWVTNPGEFASGIATIQCQYAPQLSAHSAGKTITVNQKE